MLSGFLSRFSWLIMFVLSVCWNEVCLVFVVLILGCM